MRGIVERKEMINRNSDLSISRQAELLGFSRGMVYCTPKPISESDRALMHAIDKLHMAHPFMGARMLRNQCQRDGFNVGRQHVRTLMRRMGIHAIYRKPRNIVGRILNTRFIRTCYAANRSSPIKYGRWIPATSPWKRALSI